MRSLGGAAAVAVAIAIAGCGGPDKLSKAEVERGGLDAIKKELPAELGDTKLDLTCPNGVEAKKGKSVVCEISIEIAGSKQSESVRVTVEKVDGDKVTYSVDQPTPR